ncbi:MAG TPA: condensation domain-containing protein, partial [Stellaceae bacterium]|nr:condensation domain-containing protein [Stellaceae bacterium]
ALPRTASGKLDRRALPAPVWREGAAAAPPEGAVEELLAGIWAELLGVERVGRHDSFFELGGDSIVSIQLVSRARAAGIELTSRQIFQAQTLERLAQLARPRSAAGNAVTSDGLPVPLTPIQQIFVAQPGPLSHFNQAILLQVPPRLDKPRLQRAFATAIDRHDALRLRLLRTEEGWRQRVASPSETGQRIELGHRDLAGLSATDAAAQIEAGSAHLQSALDPVNGPLCAALWFDCGDSAGRLLLAIHHLAVDAVSWRILVEDLATAYEQLAQGGIRLPPPTTPFQNWATLLAREAQTPAVLADLPHWQSICVAVSELPRDHAGAAANRVADSERLTVELDTAVTRQLLRQAPRAYHTDINDMLLAGLALALAEWSETRYGAPLSDEHGFVIDLEGHGREELSPAIDLSRTIGWFTSLYPIHLALGAIDRAAAFAGGAAAGTALKRIKEALRAVPRKGLSFGLLSQLNPETATALAAAPARPLLFNYLGQFDQTGHRNWRLAEESPGPMVAGERQRGYLLEVNALVRSGRLRIEWTWCRDLHERQSIAALAELFLSALRGLAAHCVTPGVGGHTPSDFPLAPMSAEDVERLERDYPDLEAVYPLSPLQQGLRFHALYAGKADPYRVQLCLGLEGPLDVGLMRLAWQRLFERHEALRVALIEQDGRPLQVVRRGLALPWHEDDWSALDDASFPQRLAAFLAEDRAAGFDFAAGPLMRVALFRQSAVRWTIVLTNHHLVLDGWSSAVLLSELLLIYRQLRAGEPSVLPVAPPYRDYLDWLSQQDGAATHAYWRRRLAGAAALPDIFDRSSQSSPDMREHRVMLPAASLAEINRFARRHGLTLGTLVHAAWAVVLAQRTGHSDVVFGTTSAGRPGDLVGVERMVGLFINTLPLRARVAAEIRIGEWLLEFQALQSEDRRHGHAALAEIQREAGGGDLFETLVVIENYPIDAALLDGDGQAVSGVRVTSVSAVERTHYPLTLIAQPRRSLELRLAFDRSRLDEATAARLLAHLEWVLGAMAAHPERRVSALSLLSAAERHAVIEDWNATAAAVPEATLADLVAAAALQHGDAVAAVCGGESLSYAALDERANRLARRLIALGVGPERVVGVALERSLDLVVALLAVVKAGGCYLALERGLPAARLAFLLRDAGAALVVTAGAAALPESVPALRLDDDAEAALIAALPATPLAPSERLAPLVPDHLAYIIYTSGSTGAPKGV